MFLHFFSLPVTHLSNSQGDFMRKLLLATTAMIGFAVSGAAHAATSPVTVNVGGSVDFLAGAYAESNRGQTTGVNSSAISNLFMI
jgi:hypothetical protein